MQLENWAPRNPAGSVSTNESWSMDCEVAQAYMRVDRVLQGVRRETQAWWTGADAQPTGTGRGDDKSDGTGNRKWCDEGRGSISDQIVQRAEAAYVVREAPEHVVGY